MTKGGKKMKTIKLRIFKTGKVQAEIAGIKGKACTNYIGILEDLANAETVDSQRTPEYYEVPQQVEEDVVVQNNLKA